MKPRLTTLFTGPMQYVVAAVVVALALMMPPLELLPFAVVVPGVGVLILGLSLTAHDGVLAILGAFCTLGTIALIVIAFAV